MMRKYAWLAICGTMLSAFGLSAQTPTSNGNPAVNGYSGYPMPRYDRAPGVLPTLPTGQPMFQPRVPGGSPAPHMPYAGNSPLPAAPVGGLPKNTGEPYLVLPDDSA